MSRSRPGFGLLEAVVAVAIVGAVGFAAMATIAAQNDVAYRTRRQIEASALAQCRLAEIGLANNEELHGMQQSTPEGRFAPPFENYQWTATITADPAATDLFRAIVRVQWSDDQSVTLGTAYYRSKPDAAP